MIPVAILGAGRIAQGFDSVLGDVVLTHAKAYQRHGGFELLAFSDKDPDLARSAAKRWRVPHAVSTMQELRDLKPAVISICTPDETHQDMLASCLDLEPKLVFCEKPLALDFEKAEELVGRYHERNIGLMVNYSRRWSAPARECCRLIQEGGYGKIISVRARYYGGWFHNGSHLVDLLGLFFNPSVAGGSLLRKEAFGHGDFRLTGSAVLKQDEHAFVFQFECNPDDSVSHFELEMLFERGAFWIGERNGTVWRQSGISENSLYPGYHELEEGLLKTADPSGSIQRAVENIDEFLTGGAPLISNGATALATLKRCSAICQLPEIVDYSIWQSSQ